MPTADPADPADPAKPTNPARIKCANCPAACCRLEVPSVGDFDIPDYLTESDDGGFTRMRRLEDGWCAALDRTQMNCGIYARRPLACRELEMGGPDCLAEQARL
ncbi:MULTISPECIES: YkgJ family cysteine cluster protein [Thiorhodovibrio]|uniref:YkgJ family cysteine cluster protein n=1 Tax=Thiorhodovibrio TaxID=61593 RepID=UPI001911EA3C|nr:MULTISPECIES: YkgJ family cysteine cluster protein [Thiorhodovibrio]MBK5970183.1 hypothetical protein [Thiorhodovibrio winogradskyi]WPL13983.1 Flagellin N-methylase [Thiorhodovibrio litoralis]